MLSALIKNKHKNYQIVSEFSDNSNNNIRGVGWFVRRKREHCIVHLRFLLLDLIINQYEGFGMRHEMGHL